MSQDTKQLMVHSIINKDGYKFISTHDRASVDSFSDEEVVRARYFYPFLKAGMKFVDVGSSYGSYTLPACAKGCNVVCFNIPDVTLMALKENLRINNFNIKIIEKAAYSKKGYLNAYKREFVPDLESIPDEYKNLAPTAKDSHVGGGRQPYDYYFECISLDDVNIDKVDYIKLDIEGSEIQVLEGAENIIKKNKPVLLVENHNFIDKSLEKQAIDLVDSWNLGYKHETRDYTPFVSHTLFT